MTSEVAVIRRETMALEPLFRVDPTPRSSPPMRMTASWRDPQRDRPNTRRVGARIRLRDANELSSGSPSSAYLPLRIRAVLD